MLKTVLEARQSTLVNISGSCSNTSAFLALLNEATETLMRRGDWAGTVIPIHVCVRKGCVVWPRYVGSVRKMNLCRYRLPIKNLWWDFMPVDQYRDSCAAGCSMVSRGKASTYSDVYGDGRYIRAYPVAYSDLGKVVTIFGIDNNNQPLRTNRGGGVWDEGVEIVLDTPFGSTSTYVRRIDRVLKDETEGNVFLYAYDVANDILEDLAVYEPSETNPDYVKYTLNIPSCGTSCGTSQGVNALIKLKFIPARADTDLVLIDNLEALKMMMMSVKNGEAGDLSSKRDYELEAIRSLNLQLRDELPDDQMPVAMEVFGGANIGMQRMI